MISDAERLAQTFHETYERLAPSFGYATRPASAVAWEAVPAINKGLMIAVASELLKDPSTMSDSRLLDIVRDLAVSPSPDMPMATFEAHFRCVLCNARRPQHLIRTSYTEPDPIDWHDPDCVWRRAKELMGHR